MRRVQDMVGSGMHFRGMVRALVEFHGSTGQEPSRLRAAHLSAVVHLTPYAMVANLGCGVLLLWCFAPAVPPAMLTWFGCLLALSLVATASWARKRGRPIEVASRRAVRRSMLHAGLLAAIWGCVPLFWFADATLGQQLTIATLITGLLGAGTFMLATLPAAAGVYALIFAAGSAGALWRAANPAFVWLGLLLTLYVPMVILGALALWQKSTATLRAEWRANDREALLRVLLREFEEDAGDALWETGADGRLVHASQRLADLLDVVPEEASVQPFIALLERQIGGIDPALRRAFAGTEAFRDVSVTQRTGGPARHLVLHGRWVPDMHGAQAGWRGVISDVTARVEADRRLRDMATRDALTGLANRAALREHLARHLAEGGRGAVLTVDLDNFKAVNDSLGHSTGDALLRHVAGRIQGRVRSGDLVARMGGDEFAVVMVHPNQPFEGETLARRLIDAVSEPAQLGGRTLRVGASVGVAMMGDEQLGVDELLVRSDVALYEAKSDGRGRCALYSTELGDRRRRRLAIEEGLHQAIEDDALELHWQARVDIATWTVGGAEALLRWTHPVLGAVPPMEFIAVAEQCGLVDSLGRWALTRACAAAAGPLAGLPISVNVSPLQLRDEQLGGYVADLLRRFAIADGGLELEITESAFLDDPQHTLSQLHVLRALGVRIALDDFGTGYSSLAYLRRFPFDTLKIDRAFVREVVQRADARIIIDTIARMANGLGMQTVCEGVETAQQLQIVERVGCHAIQGYLASVPLPLDEFVRALQDWQRGAQRPLRVAGA